VKWEEIRGAEPERGRILVRLSGPSTDRGLRREEAVALAEAIMEAVDRQPCGRCGCVAAKHARKIGTNERAVCTKCYPNCPGFVEPKDEWNVL
jgi:hypothetical protein